VSVTLRRMRWWDLDQVLPLERTLFPDDPWSAEVFWSELAGWPQTRHYVVAERDGRVVGYGGLMGPRRAAADIQTVAVAPDAQGEGIGDAVLASLLAEARQRGCPDVLLEVHADNAAAQRLYARHGFERVSVRRGYYRATSGGPAGDALVLRCRLTAKAPS
jgi:ribosomal-protein-alanine N-acetyltransferase